MNPITLNMSIFFPVSHTFLRMDAPPLFGWFHILAAITVTVMAFASAALVVRRRMNVTKVLSVTGWLLFILEICKQIFLYTIVNGGAYDWWYFPFQLCSVPMYLCMLLPFTGARIRNTFLTFMSGYTFISAAAALIYPEDFLRPYVFLTAHGFLWHGILLFISLVIILSGTAAEPVSAGGSLLRAACLFVLLCVIAVCINMAVEPSMQAIHAAHPEVAHSWAAMFYLNPYHISPQPVISGIQKTAGIPAGLVIYAFAIILAGSAFTALSGHLRQTVLREYR